MGAGLTLQGAGREGKLGNFPLFSVLPDILKVAFKALLSGSLTVLRDFTMPYFGTASDLLDPCLYLQCVASPIFCMVLFLIVYLTPEPTFCVFDDTFLCVFLCVLGVTDLPVSVSVVHTECVDSPSDSSDS